LSELSFYPFEGVRETGIWRSPSEIKSVLDSIDGKIVKADTDNAITFTEYQVKAAEDKAFFLTYLKTGLSSGSSTSLLIENPSDSKKTVYVMLLRISTTDQGIVHYKTGASYSGGTAITPHPLRLASTATSVLKAVYDPSVSSATEIGAEVVPGGSGRRAIGGANGGYLAFEINSGENLLIVFDNTSSNSNDVSIRLDWWEE